MTPQERLALALQYQKQRDLGSALPSTPAENAARPVREPEQSWLDKLSEAASGVGYGLGQQVEGLGQMARHPLDTLHSLAVGAGKAMDNPSAAAQAAWEGLKQSAGEAVSSPFNLGQAVGANVNINPRKLAAMLESPAVRRDIFIGESAKTWNQKEADRALAMEAVGVEPETIWKETGTFRGPEGKWRQEISDKDATGWFTHSVPEGALSPTDLAVKLSLLKKSSFNPLSDSVLKHPELMAAYPDLEDIRQFGLQQPQIRGSYAASHIDEGNGPRIMNEEIMALAPNKEELASVALHEMQHAIQNREGFQRGASLSEFKDKTIPPKLKDTALSRSMQQMEISNKMRELGYPVNEGKMLNLALPSVLEKAKEFAKDNQQLNDLIEKYQILNNKLQKYPDKYSQYVRSAGEVEARAVQKRQNMTPEERRATFPFLSYDVPANQLVLTKK